MDLSAFVSGSLGAALFTGLYTLIKTVLDKKLRSPGDELAREDSAIKERNDLLAQYRADLVTVKGELSGAEQQVDELQAKVRKLYVWVGAAQQTIKRLGGSEADVPPLPD